VNRNEKRRETVLSLGSNIGEREWNVLRAVQGLDSLADFNLKRLSPLYESEPVGKGYSSNFINAAALFSTGLDASSILELCRRIESGMGRDLSIPKTDRIIDIDIILYGDAIIRTADLTIPHPEFSRRAFVVVPMLRICPEIEIPGTGRTLAATALDMKLSGWARVVSKRYFTA